MQSNNVVNDKVQEEKYPTCYREKRIGKTIYRITTVYKGQIDLKDALEDLVVRRAVLDSMIGT